MLGFLDFQSYDRDKAKHSPQQSLLLPEDNVMTSCPSKKREQPEDDVMTSCPSKKLARLENDLTTSSPCKTSKLLIRHPSLWDEKTLHYLDISIHPYPPDSPVSGGSEDSQPASSPDSNVSEDSQLTFSGRLGDPVSVKSERAVSVLLDDLEFVASDDEITPYDTEPTIFDDDLLTAFRREFTKQHEVPSPNECKQIIIEYWRFYEFTYILGALFPKNTHGRSYGNWETIYSRYGERNTR
ncbi:hypothetical protein EJ06DRAFT_525061 [Trichodelitschia bisporula]|uniref:Uncharacterized protein n=1 Tax=Trichodelitschia bisporula TaxID=703511 RepID=A0A6G1HJJ1_9PEZI|nr:hypothetical protein EJ06DRAFT_525061 [Trichodelitschia bisporula]